MLLTELSGHPKKEFLLLQEQADLGLHGFIRICQIIEGAVRSEFTV